MVQAASAAIVLFAIIDPLGCIPLLLDFERRGDRADPWKVVPVSLAIMLVFLLAGEWLLGFLGVDIKSFAAAGAIVLFLLALEMVCDIEIFRYNGPKGSSSIVPLAFPLFAGPGVFTALVSLRAEYAMLNITCALVANMCFLFFELKATSAIGRIFGEAGIYIIRRFFGVVLLAMAVKLFTSNIASLVSTCQA